MRIGVLTLPLHTNYGGILQAFALQRVLKQLGHEAVLLDKERFTLPIWYLRPLKYGKRIIEKFFLRKNVSVFAEKHRIHLQRIKQRYTKEFIFTHIDRLVFRDYDEIKETDFDCLIVGSDQIWRQHYSNFMLGGISHSFLDFAAKWNVRRIAYAASFGTDEWEYTEAETETCKLLAKKFDFISVREQSGIDLCKTHFGVDAELVADPTLLLKKEDYIQLFEKTDTPPKTGQMMVYILDRTTKSDAFVERMSKKLKMTPFHTNFQVYNKQVPITEHVQPPIENWLRGFLDADYIITDSFHACVFSIIFNKQFVVIGNKMRGMARIESLLSQFGLEKQLITNEQTASVLPKIDYTSINKKIEEIRSKSLEKLQFYLKIRKSL